MRIHLYESSEPLDKLRSVTAMCGKVISPAEVVYMRDGEVFDKFLVNTSIFCQKCFNAKFENRRYLYGIANAQEVKTKWPD